jgi:hypothetical protein
MKATDKKNKLYIVRYTKGQYDSFEKIDIFVTANKRKATKYVTKFNRILKKWKKHYSQYAESDGVIDWIKDEYLEKHYKRWYSLRGINECYWQEIEIR